MTRTDFIATYVLQNVHLVGVDKALEDALIVAKAIYD